MKIVSALLILGFVFFGVSGCQSAPTKIKEEVAAETIGLDKNIVLADTRSALAFKVYHVSGSVSLNSEDFLILKNPATGKRVLDPDIKQLIERLAKRGISPIKKVKLLATKKDADENKKWRWLLAKLGVINVELMSLDEYIEKNKPLRPQPEPDRADEWTVKNTKEILSKADACFVNWTEITCN